MKWWWCSLALLTGCVGPLAQLTKTKSVGAQYLVRSDGFIDPDVVRVENALAKTAAGLERWGGLEEPVTVFVVSSHEALERAVNRSGFDWLRAWARFDDVIFQAPSTWTTNEEALEQLVLHEVTHCLLFQKAGTRETWVKKQIPLWFREGMAIVTARQQRLYPSLEDTTAWITQNPELNVFTDGEALSEQYYQPVYGFALHAFMFLEQRFGAERLLQFMATMKAGADFTTGFEASLGMPLDRFEKDFLVFLKLRGFRGAGRKVPTERPDVQEMMRLRLPSQDKQINPRPK